MVGVLVTIFGAVNVFDVANLKSANHGREGERFDRPEKSAILNCYRLQTIPVELLSRLALLRDP